MKPIPLLQILLTVLFVGLKLTSHIDWSWWWVLAPIWGPLVFFIIVGAVASAIARIILWFETPGQRAARQMREISKLMSER